MLIKKHYTTRAETNTQKNEEKNIVGKDIMLKCESNVVHEESETDYTSLLILSVDK